jgi:uncharacterized protein (DUF885 family)
LRLRIAVSSLSLVAFLTFGLPANASPAGPRLQTLARDMTFIWAKEHPLFATALGLTDEDGDLDIPTEATRAHDLAQVRAWRATLAKIPLVGTATLVERDNARLLGAQLIRRERDLTFYRTDRKDYSEPARSIVETIFSQFQLIPVPGLSGATEADRSLAWDHIISRLSKAPAYVAAAQALVTMPGRLYATAGAAQLAESPDFLNVALGDAAKAQLPPDKLRAFTTARDAFVATVNATVAYIHAHAASWPNNYAIGRRGYDAMLHDEQLLPFKTDDVIRMGYDEIAHGWAEQAWLQQDAFVDKTTLGPATGGGLAPSGDALIGYYRDQLATLTTFMTTHDVIAIPAWLGTVQVVETPKFLQPVSPGASMNPPRLFGKENNGFYFITPAKSFEDAAKHLDIYEDFDRDRILSTAGHEVMPGHYLQLSIARRNPDFVRRIQDSSVFSEGWAYYGEEMLTRLGLYGSDLDGRLDVAAWERVRGARAITDAELAAGNWSFERAADFFAGETGATKDESRAAVTDIALFPGDVISYTIGRFQIEQLLAEYERRTGDKGSLYDFHTRLMCYGSTPLTAVAPELLTDLSKPLAQVRASADY